MTPGVVPAAQGRCKGVILRVVLDWYKTKRGAPAMAKVMAKMPTAYSSLLSPERDGFGLLAGSWYPNPLFHSILESIVASGYEPGALGRDASTAVMNATMSGLYRALFQRIATPALYARYANHAWGTYHDTGHCHLELVEENRIESRVTGWLGHHPIMCDMNLHAAIVIFTAMSCRDVRTWRRACISRGDPHCESTILWSGRR